MLFRGQGRRRRLDEPADELVMVLGGVASEQVADLEVSPGVALIWGLPRLLHSACHDREF